MKAKDKQTIFDTKYVKATSHKRLLAPGGPPGGRGRSMLLGTVKGLFRGGWFYHKKSGRWMKVRARLARPGGDVFIGSKGRVRTRKRTGGSA